MIDDLAMPCQNSPSSDLKNSRSNSRSSAVFKNHCVTWMQFGSCFRKKIHGKFSVRYPPELNSDLDQETAIEPSGVT